jgi:hypothetical protein
VQEGREGLRDEYWVYVLIESRRNSVGSNRVSHTHVRKRVMALIIISLNNHRVNSFMTIILMLI